MNLHLDIPREGFQDPWILHEVKAGKCVRCGRSFLHDGACFTKHGMVMTGAPSGKVAECRYAQ